MKNFAKILCVLLCLSMVLTFAPVFANEAETHTITTVIENHAAANAWANGTMYNTLVMNSEITVTATGTAASGYGANTGKYYENGQNWRVYQAETPSIVVSANEATISTVKFTYASQNDGVITFNGTNVESDQVVEVNATSATFSVGNLGEKTNGQARITAIEVTYVGGAFDAPVTPVIVKDLNIDEHMDAAKWTFNGEKAAIENGQLNLPAVGDTAAAMLNESAQNASFNFTMTINEVPADCYDKWWDTELLIIARSSFADKSWSDDFAQTGYTLTSWGDMTEWFIGRAGNDDLSGKIVLNIADGQPHNFQLKVVNNADNTTVTVTLIVDGEQVAEIIDDGSKIKNERPALYPDAGNFTVRAKNVDVSIGTFKAADPEADTTLTIAEAIALGASKEHNAYTDGKYYVTGVVTEVYNEKYGNMYITDEAGNTFTVYGTYSADGSTRYDAMDVKPVAGDTVTVYGIIGQYNGTAQMKNGWLTAHTPAVEDPAPTEPTEPETSVPETTVPETSVPTTTKPVEPGTNPGTGDNGVLMTAVGMMMAAACLIVLVQKKRAI